MDRERDWLVLLLGGASGVGKTNVSYRLARHFDVGITEIDDFQAILEGMTTPEQYPAVHWWRLHPEERRTLDDDGRLHLLLNYSAVMAEALSLVIANHLESEAPVLLEGDFILPSLAVQSEYNGIPADGRVRAVFLHEEDEGQLRRNFMAREGEDQPARARTSWLHSEWLRQECLNLGVPAEPARPWRTVLKRVVKAIS